MNPPSPTRLLELLLAEIEMDPAWAQKVTFTSSEPVYDCPIRFGTAAAVAQAACAIVGDLLQGDDRSWQIDIAEAAVGTHGFRHLLLDDLPIASPRDELTGFYPCSDGANIFLHLNFPHHRRRLQPLLGTLENRDSIANAVMKFSGSELEAAAVQAGACAALAVDSAQWRASEQGRAVASEPSLEISRIGDSAVERPPAGRKPLTGVSSIEMTRVLAGPIGGRTLAEFGAKVIHIQNPRYPDLLSYQLDAARDKLTWQLDLEHEKDRITLLDELRRVDVFQQGYRLGVAQKFGLDLETLVQARPGLICTSHTAFGQSGPWAARRGFDTVIQSATGLAMIQGGGTPKLLPTSPTDYVTGYLLALGTFVALYRRATQGGSYSVRASLAKTADWVLDCGLVSPAEPEASQRMISEIVARRRIDSPSSRGRVSHLRGALQRR